MGNVQNVTSLVPPGSDEIGIASNFIRVLVLDSNKEIHSHIEHALWVWPHRVSMVASTEKAVQLCRHLMPSAILAGIEQDGKSQDQTISELRRRLPNVPIVALVSREQSEAPAELLSCGADALLVREDAGRPTLYDLLMSVQRKEESSPRPYKPRTPELALPWRQSVMIGALICDIKGSIVDCNARFAEWLGYPDRRAVLGKNVARDVLADSSPWSVWKQVAGDTNAIVHQDVSVFARNAQVLWMQVEVVATPDRPSYLQAMFADRSELALLTGREA